VSIMSMDTNKKNKRVIVGMSGGVDSSVTAALLKREGYDVAGVIMEIYDDSMDIIEGAKHACFGPGEMEDLEDAQKVSDQLGIPLYTVDLKEQYRKNIISYFVNEYKAGNTPNPCAKCNREMKFGAILEELEKKGIPFDYFATGHYARIEKDEKNDRVILKKGIDHKKDQSYFLYHLKESQLKKFIFPLGVYTKDQIRDFAKEFDITVAEKPESQDFIAGGYHQLFDEPGKPGPILDSEGNELGKHKGLIYYAVGQRRGIGIASENPLYVLAKDAEKNAIVVGPKEDLMGMALIAKEMIWVNFDRLTEAKHLRARIRYLSKEVEVEVSPIEGSVDRVKVTFYEAQSAISPGQVVVLYDGDIVMGGGIIEKEIKNEE
jgi:tRNA-uridine 2-sulfurtransferase